MENLPSPQELQKAYEQVSMGTDTPSLITGKCPECGSNIILTKDYKEYCIHFKNKIENG